MEEKNVEVKEVYSVKDWLDENKKLLTNTLATEIDEMELEKISQLANPTKVIAIIRKIDWGKRMRSALKDGVADTARSTNHQDRRAKSD